MDNERLNVLLFNAIALLLEYLTTDEVIKELGMTKEEFNEIMGNEEDDE